MKAIQQELEFTTLRILGWVGASQICNGVKRFALPHCRGTKNYLLGGGTILRSDYQGFTLTLRHIARGPVMLLVPCFSFFGHAAAMPLLAKYYLLII